MTSGRTDSIVEYLQAQQSVPFAWGTADCVQLAAGAVEVLTGSNPATQFYYDSESAAAIIAPDGLEPLLVSALGAPRKDFANSQDGDVVLSVFPGIGEVLGVVCGRRAWFKTKRGPLLRVELGLCLKYWSVECRR